jgi:plastocyanin
VREFCADSARNGPSVAQEGAPTAHKWCAVLLTLLLSVVLVTLFTLPARGADLTVTVADPQGRGVADVAVIAEPAVKPEHIAPPARHAIMDQHNLMFEPEVLVVQTGTLVDFPNSDQVQHQVYSFSRAKTFQLSLYAGRAHPPVQFDRAGIVTVGCNIHDFMIGFIYVTDSPYFGQTDAAGRVELHGLPAGDYKLTAWHPRASQTDGLQQSVSLTAEQAAAVALRFGKPLRPAMENMEHGKQWAAY